MDFYPRARGLRSSIPWGAIKGVRPPHLPPLTHMMMASIVAELIRGPCTFEELRENTGLAKNTARYVVRALWYQGVARVCGWLPSTDGRNVVPVFAIDGKYTDVPRPPRLANAERQQRVRNRQKTQAALHALTQASSPS